MCCFVRQSYIICINTSSFLYNLSALLILFQHLIELSFKIRSFNVIILRLINYAFEFALFTKFFFSCIFTLFVVSRDTTCFYKFDDDVFFDVS